jgi:hypothetical protein
MKRSHPFRLPSISSFPDLFQIRTIAQRKQDGAVENGRLWLKILHIERVKLVDPSPGTAGRVDRYRSQSTVTAMVMIAKCLQRSFHGAWAVR